jgi:hypothetical protein
MVTAEELVVAVRDEGIGQTRENLEGVEQSMEETADAASDSAEDLGEFTSRIQGAMSAAAAGVAIAAGSLLSQVPIISELVAGLGAVFGALGLQVDQLIRDLGAGGFVDALFNVASAINNAEGFAADLVGVLTTLATIVAGAAAGFAAYAVATLGWIGAASKFIGAAKAVGVAIAGVISSIGAVPAALAGAIAALVAFGVAYLTNFRGIRDKTNAIIGRIIDFVVGGITSFIETGLSKLDSFVGNFVGFFTGLAEKVSTTTSDIANGIADWLTDLVADAKDFGAQFVSGFLGALEGLSDRMASLFEAAFNTVIKTINTAIDKLPDIVTSKLNISQIDQLDFAPVDASPGGGGTTGTNGGGGGSGLTGRVPTGNGRRQAFEASVDLDGRRVSEDTGRYRVDPSRRRGL